MAANLNAPAQTGLKLSSLIGEKDIPKVIAQGVLDVTDLPAEGEERAITVPLIRPLTGKPIGSLTLILRA